MRYLLFVSALILLSCSGKQEDVVDFDELTEKSARYDEDSLKKEQQTAHVFYYDSLSSFSKSLVDSLEFDMKSIFPLDSVFFSDRFGAQKTEKWCYKTNKDSLVFFHWEFKDSIKTFNTFYNWLDCYGTNCKSLKVGQEAKFSKRATLFMIQDKHLFFVESELPLDYERYLQIFDNSKWKKRWSYIVYQAPRKKAVWLSRSWDEKGKKNNFVVIKE